MKIDNPEALAASRRTAHQAARAAVALETEISLGSRDEDWYAAADKALDELRGRFPGCTQLDAYQQPPALSPTARQQLGSMPDWRRSRDMPPRSGRHWVLGAAAVMAAIAGVLALVARHFGRHPSHAFAGVLVVGSLAAGHPELIGVAAVLLVWGRLSSDGRSGMRAPRMPRAPRITVRMPRAPGGR